MSAPVPFDWLLPHLPASFRCWAEAVLGDRTLDWLLVKAEADDHAHARCGEPVVQEHSSHPLRPLARHERHHRALHELDDPLRSIPAAVYSEALTGRPVSSSGKVRCPFHSGGDERTPSLHVYQDPARGWCCHACHRGGSYIDFCAYWYGIEPRGAGYHEIRRRFAADLGLRRSAA